MTERKQRSKRKRARADEDEDEAMVERQLELAGTTTEDDELDMFDVTLDVVEGRGEFNGRLKGFNSGSEGDAVLLDRKEISWRGAVASQTGDLIPAHRDFSGLQLKADADKRPIWVCTNNRVYLETFSAIYKQAYDFLIAISDPVAR